MSAMVLGSAVGPAFFALVEASVGSYRVPLLLSIVGPASGLILGLLPDRAAEPPAPD
jgi:OFA family oxalate/formate antiporter-like MFS transporter